MGMRLVKRLAEFKLRGGDRSVGTKEGRLLPYATASKHWPD
jgi:hypothetical protein